MYEEVTREFDLFVRADGSTCWKLVRFAVHCLTNDWDEANVEVIDNPGDVPIAVIEEIGYVCSNGEPGWGWVFFPEGRWEYRAYDQTPRDEGCGRAVGTSVPTATF
jgi:hypothetical protein